MQRYGNLNGDSGVKAFEITEESITVQFSDGSTYLYNEIRPGKLSVDRMKSLALRGEGLNSFISSTVRKNYAAKLR